MALTLPLLVTGVVADHENHAAPTDELAVFADSFDARANFHGLFSGFAG
jgi:hypothetical protein